MSDLPLEPDISLPFPIEFVIRDTPRSHQSPNAKAKELWKRKVREIADAHVKTLREFCFIDQRPLAATIFYFPPVEMDGDLDNIVKLVVNGMVPVIHLDDRVLERITVQEVRTGHGGGFSISDSTLERAVETDPPVIYIRIDDDLGWRQVS